MTQLWWWQKRVRFTMMRNEIKRTLGSRCYCEQWHFWRWKWRCEDVQNETELHKMQPKIYSQLIDDGVSAATDDNDGGGIVHNWELVMGPKSTQLQMMWHSLRGGWTGWIMLDTVRPLADHRGPDFVTFSPGQEDQSTSCMRRAHFQTRSINRSITMFPHVLPDPSR